LNKPPRIICFGDSITHAQNYAEADRWTTHLAFHLEEAAPGAYEVFNRGIGGNTTSLALDRIQIDVIPLLPGSVLVEFGINGAALEIARHAGIPIIDLPSFLKLEQMRMEEFWAEDGVHLSPAGNRLYARLVFAALRELRLIC